MQYFIKIEDLKKRGLIHQNTDEKILRVVVKRVQDRIIQPALGSILYRALLQRVEDNDWNANYNELMTYVQEALISSVDAKLVRVGTFKETNKGTITVSGDNIAPVSIQELNQFKDELDADAFYYLERLIGFLKDDCGTNYPEYTQAITRTNHDLKKDKNGYKTNWIV